MNIFNKIIEILTSPFSFLLKSSLGTTNNSKLCKAGIILLISIAVLAILILCVYRKELFKG